MSGVFAKAQSSLKIKTTAIENLWELGSLPEDWTSRGLLNSLFFRGGGGGRGGPKWLFSSISAAADRS